MMGPLSQSKQLSVSSQLSRGLVAARSRTSKPVRGLSDKGGAPSSCRSDLGLACVFPVEPQSPNGQNINLHKKWGFRRFQKECQKVRKTALFAEKVRKKCGFSALFGTLSGISGSFARGRCRRGRSEIPHFCSKLLLFALVL